MIKREHMTKISLDCKDTWFKDQEPIFLPIKDHRFACNVRLEVIETFFFFLINSKFCNFNKVKMLIIPNMFWLFFSIAPLLNEGWSEQIINISLMTMGSWRATGGMLLFFFLYLRWNWFPSIPSLPKFSPTFSSLEYLFLTPHCKVGFHKGVSAGG